jgi:hypothetical protein
VHLLEVRIDGISTLSAVLIRRLRDHNSGNELSDHWRDSFAPFSKAMSTRIIGVEECPGKFFNAGKRCS